MDIEVNVTIVWTGPTGNTIRSTSITLIGNSTTLESEVTVTVLRTNESGNYTCSVRVETLKGFQHTYLNDSGATVSNKSKITTGIS